MGRKSKLYFRFNLSILFVFIALLSIVGATYAWFTLSANTKQTPFTSSVSAGDMVLTVSDRADGQFGDTSPIARLDQCDTLVPVSTNDIVHFYSATAQNRDGKIFLYKDVSQQISEKVLYGEVFLQARYRDGYLYFDTEKFNITGDAQLLSASRLGMKFSDGDSESIYIFDLQDFARGEVIERTTIETETGKVVAGIDENGNATFQEEQAEEISAYAKTLDEVNSTSPLFEITRDQLVRVEFWIYMEGCDPHCINEAQESGIEMNLAFVADEKEESATIE